MARLPQPGGDNGQWGQILNDFLAVEHNADGTLKKAADIAAKYEKPNSGIPAGDLSTATQASLTKADSAVQSVNAVFPSSGNVVLTASDVNAIPLSQKGQIGGIAELDVAGKVPVGRMPDVVTRKTTRRAMAVLSTPGVSQYTNTQLAFRVPFIVPATTSRWRLRIRNFDVLNNTPITSGAVFLASYIGEQAFDASGNQTGAFTAVPTQALPGFTLPADGSEYVSDWVDGSAQQFSLGVPYLLSMAYTGGGTQRHGVGRMWFSSQSSLAAQQAASNFNSIETCIFDIRVEYEAETSGLVVAAIGDSTTQGAGSSTHPICTYQRWPERWALRTSNLVVNGGLSSATLSSWSTPTLWSFQRFNPTEITYDIVITDLGINGVGAGLAAFQSGHITHISALRSVFGQNIRIFANGIKPYDTFSHGTITTHAYAGATTFQSNIAFSSGTAVRIGTGRTADARTVSGAPTGTGPYTHTISVALANDHNINEVIAGGNEQARQDINAYLATLPSGIEGFFPTHLAVQAPWNEAKWNPHLSVDAIHPSITGHAAIANSIPSIK